MDLDAAFQYCERIARSHYENFPVGSWWIPREKRRYLYALYAFARTADDVADEPGVADRRAHLDRWEALLESCYEGRPEGPIFYALLETVTRHRIPKAWLQDLLRAFRMDLEVTRYPTWEALLGYCRYSANPVGRMVLHVFGHWNPRDYPYSDAICTALQLTNFWQDVALDWQRGRIYIPQEEMKRWGYTEADLAQGRCTPAFQQLMARLIHHTREWFVRGQPLLERVIPDLQMELRLIWLGGMRILEKIEAVGYDVFRRRPVIRTWDLPLLLWRAWRLG